MHIIPAIENNADGFSSFALNLFKQHPHFHQQPRLGFLRVLSTLLRGIQSFLVIVPGQDSQGQL